MEYRVALDFYLSVFGYDDTYYWEVWGGEIMIRLDRQDEPYDYVDMNDFEDGYMTFSFGDYTPQQVKQMGYKLEIWAHLSATFNPTTVIVRNNLDSRTVTVPAHYIPHPDGTFTTKIYHSYFGTGATSVVRQLGIYDKFITGSNYTQGEYYSIRASTHSVPCTVTLGEPFVTARNNINGTVKQIPLKWNAKSQSYTFEFEIEPILTNKANWEKFIVGFENNSFLQNNLFTEKEWRQLSKPFNDLFPVPADYRLNAIYTDFDINIKYSERVFKERDRGIHGFLFEMPVERTRGSFTISFGFSNKKVDERPPYTGEKVGDVIDDIKNGFDKIFGGDFDWKNILMYAGIAIVAIILLIAFGPKLLVWAAKFLVWLVLLPFKIIKWLIQLLKRG